ncbi:MAG TPA: HAD-IIA family hydrolase [Candidatus Limnocylindrales bacterium]|nr:HAD-IIA family hydrolase [Candidatus Limnocylindrales bacterium]
MLLLVDLDGVVYRGADPVPGIAGVLATRAAAGDSVVYVTNNSMHYRADYVRRLADLGCPVSPDRIVSAPRATALYLREHEPSVHRVLTVGASGLDRELRDVGLDVVNAGVAAERMAKEGLDGWEASAGVDAVVAGVDPQFTYLRLAAAADCLRAGAARFIATNRDPTFPTERFIRPGAGSIVSAIEVASGVTPVVIGKPEPLLMEQAAHAGGGQAADAIVIGDGIVTDLEAACRVGARTVLMLTGVTTRAAADALPPDRAPAAIAADAAELAQALDALAGA